MAGMLRLEAARERIVEAMTPVEGRRRSCSTTRSAACSPSRCTPQPTCHAGISAMDGYALSARDLPRPRVALAIMGTSFAGRPWNRRCLRDRACAS